SERQPLVSRDFDVVLLKAVAWDPDERYATVAEFREDWRRARAGILPRARAATHMERAIRAARQHPWQLIAAGALALLAILLPIVFGPRTEGSGVVRPAREPPAPALKPIVRTVTVQTEPAGAHVVLVPLNRDTGLPPSENDPTIRRPTQLTPLTL